MENEAMRDELAISIYVNALSTATGLGSMTDENLKYLFSTAARIAYIAADAMMEARK